MAEPYEKTLDQDQNQDPPGSWSRSGNKLKIIDCEFVDTDLQDVAEEIGRRVGRTITVSPEVEETVTITLEDIEWLDAIRIIAKLTRCEIAEGKNGEILLSQVSCGVTVNICTADVRSVLLLLATYMDKKILIEEDVRGNSNVSVKGLSHKDTVRAICLPHGFNVYEDPDRGFLIILAKHPR